MSVRELPVTLVCEVKTCRGSFEVSARHARLIRAGKHPQKCRRCCGIARRKQMPTLPVTDTERRYWLDRFSDYEIASIASTCFGRTVLPESIAMRRAAVLGESEPLRLAASAGG